MKNMSLNKFNFWNQRYKKTKEIIAKLRMSIVKYAVL